jgi:hypothetical protein
MLLALAIAAAAVGIAERPVLVVDLGGTAVSCTLYRVTAKDERIRLGADKMGAFELEGECAIGEVLRAEPDNIAAYYWNKLECPVQKFPARIVLTHRGLTPSLLSQAKNAEDRTDYGTAALLYNEYRVRAATIETTIKPEDRQGVALPDVEESKVYESFFKAIDGSSMSDHIAAADWMVSDPQQARKVLSSSAVEKVREYQRDRGIPVTGQIDYRTLSSAAKKDIWMYLSPPIGPQ